MPRTPTRRAVNSVALLAQLGVEHGIPAERSLLGTDLSQADLRQPDAEVEAWQELAVVRNLTAAHAGGLGLLAGTRYHFTTYGIWGFALVSSPTLRSAIDLALRYLDLTYAFCDIFAEEGADEFRLVFDDAGIPADARLFLFERDAAAAFTLQREVFSASVSLRRLMIRHPAPPYADRYEQLFGLQPVFGAEHNVMALDRALLDMPIPQANEHTARMCEAQCRELLDQRRTRRTGVAGSVRDELLRHPDRMPDLEEVARILHTSVRTLRRRLDEEGTSFRTLLAEVRQTLGEELLRTGLTVEEVARRLGYAETASFTHAFRRWKGAPPTRYRKTSQAHPRDTTDPAA